MKPNIRAVICCLKMECQIHFFLFLWWDRKKSASAPNSLPQNPIWLVEQIFGGGSSMRNNATQLKSSILCLSHIFFFICACSFRWQRWPKNEIAFVWFLPRSAFIAWFWSAHQFDARFQRNVCLSEGSAPHHKSTIYILSPNIPPISAVSTWTKIHFMPCIDSNMPFEAFINFDVISNRLLH